MDCQTYSNEYYLDVAKKRLEECLIFRQAIVYPDDSNIEYFGNEISNYGAWVLKLKEKIQNEKTQAENLSNPPMIMHDGDIEP